MLKFLEKKYPSHIQKIRLVDFIIDIAFWILVLWVWFFGIKAMCDPYIICGDCFQIPGLNPGNMSLNLSIPITIT